MSIRLRIARWLAPELAWANDAAAYWERSADSWSVKAMVRGQALEAISKQRTHGANAAVRRMASIAEAALAHPGIPESEAA